MDALFASSILGPLLIFVLRIVDVSMATVRHVLSVRGQKTIVPLIGALEVTIWLLAVSRAMAYVDRPLHVAGYALGFAAGTYIGLCIEEKLALGLATVRVIAATGGVELADALREKGYGVTEISGQGKEGKVEIVLAACPRRKLPILLAEANLWTPDAFVTVEEPKAVMRGWMFDQRRK